MSDTTSKDDKLVYQIDDILDDFGHEVINSAGASRRALKSKRRRQIMHLIKQYGIQERIDELEKLLHGGVCEYIIGWAKVCEKQDNCPALRRRIAELTALKDKENE